MDDGIEAWCAARRRLTETRARALRAQRLDAEDLVRHASDPTDTIAIACLAELERRVRDGDTAAISAVDAYLNA